MLESQQEKKMLVFYMIKLTFHPETHPISYEFANTPILITKEGEVYSEPFSAHQDYVRIVENRGKYSIINQANDPFVTLNGLPFGKRSLSHKDRIQIGTISIQVEEFQNAVGTTPPLPCSSKELPEIKLNEEMNELLEKVLTPTSIDLSKEDVSKFKLPFATPPLAEKKTSYENSSLSLPLTVEQENVKKQELQQSKVNKDQLSSFEKLPLSDIESLLRQVANLEAQEKAQKNAKAVPASSSNTLSSQETDLQKIELSQKNKLEDQLEASPTFQADFPIDSEVGEDKESQAIKEIAPLPEKNLTKASLKDYYLSEAEEEGEYLLNKKKEEKQSNLPKLSWKVISAIVVATLFLFSLIIFLVLMNMNGKNNEEEIKAAAGLADVAMALANAQIRHSNPPNQNWSDPEFLKNNLLSSLAIEYMSIGTLNAHGQLNNSPYMIRIYTSKELAQFLIIAHPTPSLMQWFSPRASFIVDSKQMEMRKIDDLKALNRLLLDPNTLDKKIASEVSGLVKQGELVLLTSLAEKLEKQGFEPPKLLAQLRPGAENLIYNAPRYYHFGESFLKKISLLASQDSEEEHEREWLKQEIYAFNKYPNLVLYTGEGIQWASQAQQFLSEVAPQNKFLVAYIKFNSKGTLSSSHLLVDSGLQNKELSTNLIAKNESNKLTANHFRPLADPLEEKKVEEKKSDFLQDNRVDPKSYGNDKNAEDSLKETTVLQQLKSLSEENKQRVCTASEIFFASLNESNQPDILDFLKRTEGFLKKGLKTFPKESDNFYKTVTVLEFLDNLQIFLNVQQAEKEQKLKTTAKILQLYQEHPTLPLAEFLDYIEIAGLHCFIQKEQLIKLPDYR